MSSKFNLWDRLSNFELQMNESIFINYITLYNLILPDDYICFTFTTQQLRESLLTKRSNNTISID